MEHTDALADLDLDDPRLTDHRSGKVRESWALPGGKRLFVTTDRISAFDRVIGTIPHKGQVLNQLSAWWFERLADVVDHHLVAVPDPNASVCVDAVPLPVEVVVRARLTGSTSTSILPRYLAGERVLYGVTLPDGLEPHGPLPHPILTPTTKTTDGGHDTPVTTEQVVELGLIEPERWAEVSGVALDLFRRGTEVAADAGFVLADTKYEFGLAADGRLVLIDEVHTCDSSRIWATEGLASRLATGQGPEAFDKEPVRLWLGAVGYRGDGDPPALTDEVRAETSARYVSLFERLTGTDFEPGEQPAAHRITANVDRYLTNHPGTDTSP